MAEFELPNELYDGAVVGKDVSNVQSIAMFCNDEHIYIDNPQWMVDVNGRHDIYSINQDGYMVLNSIPKESVNRMKMLFKEKVVSNTNAEQPEVNDNEYRIDAGSNHGVVVSGSDYNAIRIRLDLKNHSPDGFSWGYEGSGCAQLALAILAHEYSDEFALEHYQRFKRDVIAMMYQDEDFSLSSADIEEWVQGL